jgi:hypothetical protein
MAKQKLSLQEISREFVNSEVTDNTATWEQIKSGSLLRIANALERLATGKTELETQKELEATQKSREYYKSRLDEALNARDRLYRRLSALRGVITKLKNKAR